MTGKYYQGERVSTLHNGGTCLNKIDDSLWYAPEV